MSSSRPPARGLSQLTLAKGVSNFGQWADQTQSTGEAKLHGSGWSDKEALRARQELEKALQADQQPGFSWLEGLRPPASPGPNEASNSGRSSWENLSTPGRGPKPL